MKWISSPLNYSFWTRESVQWEDCETLHRREVYQRPTLLQTQALSASATHTYTYWPPSQASATSLHRESPNDPHSTHCTNSELGISHSTVDLHSAKSDVKVKVRASVFKTVNRDFWSYGSKQVKQVNTAGKLGRLGSDAASCVAQPRQRSIQV